MAHTNEVLSLQSGGPRPRLSKLLASLMRNATFKVPISAGWRVYKVDYRCPSA